MAPVAEIIAVAAAHGLRLDPATVTVTEAGLDFRVALARADDGRRWVLRMPRRPDAAERAHTEAAVLRFLTPKLSVAVPDWQIHRAELIAYPALPGEPGMTLDAAGQPVWRVAPDSLRYAEALGALIAELHALPVAEAAAAGWPVHEPAAVRDRWRRDIAAVDAEFDVADALRRQWQAWLADDDYWPQWSAPTHGELYPAHVLVDGADRITGVLDWTTAEVGDPARDLTLQHALAPPAAFARTVAAYRAAGGRVWPKLTEHCAQLWSTAPVGYALFALQAGDEQHRAAAQQQLTDAAAR